ncbi:MAG: glycosyltransferase, partial [Armatimonadetes bacterium]|nr:glycosyltransferase [Armatimonadota bacterium]
MSLLILANDFPPSTGGIQRYLYGLAVALHHRGEEVVVIAADQPEASDFDATSPVPTLRVPAGGRFQTARSLAGAATNYICEGAHRHKVKAIIAGNWWPDGYAAWLVRRRTGVPYVVMGYGREMVQT